MDKSALFASRCPFSDAKSSSSAGCPFEPLTAPRSNFRLRRAYGHEHIVKNTLVKDMYTSYNPYPHTELGARIINLMGMHACMDVNIMTHMDVRMHAYIHVCMRMCVYVYL